MSHVQITLLSGITITADVDEWETTTNPATGAYTGASWTHGGSRRLAMLRLEQVAAVVFVDIHDSRPSGSASCAT